MPHFFQIASNLPATVTVLTVSVFATLVAAISSAKAQPPQELYNLCYQLAFQKNPAASRCFQTLNQMVYQEQMDAYNNAMQNSQNSNYLLQQKQYQDKQRWDRMRLQNELNDLKFELCQSRGNGTCLR